MSPHIVHKICEMMYKAEHSHFKKGLENIEARQRRILSEILKSQPQNKAHPIRTYEGFRKKIPVQNYKDFAPAIENHRRQEGEEFAAKTKKYQPTSGSTSPRKWIPYNKKLMQEFDGAIFPWIYELYKKYPGIKKGRHYWSLSWLPNEMRDEGLDLNDLSYFTPLKQFFLKQIMLMPNNAANLPSSELHKFASLHYLCSANDLSLISVWSPSFLKVMLQEILEKKELLCESLSLGKWPSQYTSIQSFFPAPKNTQQAKTLRACKTLKDLYKLWPNLCLISAWNTSSSAVYAKELQSFFPYSSFQGKGLFATEAVVTIPFEEEYCLAHGSHFYEFECQKTGKIFPSWQAQVGQKVKPIVTCGNGFFRYKMDDLLDVYGKNKSCPLLRFLGRDNTVDLVGEKLSFLDAEKIVQELRQKFPQADALCLIVSQYEQKPFYSLLTNNLLSKTELNEIQIELEQKLNQFYHFQVARDLGQLGPSQVLAKPQPLQYYLGLSERRGALKGESKIEPIQIITHELTL